VGVEASGIMVEIAVEIAKWNVKILENTAQLKKEDP